MSAPLRLEGIGHTYGAGPVLQNISLGVAAGEYVALLGPSGCGKTTLLSILGGFVMPAAGRVFIADADVTALTPARRPTATVFQDYALFPHMTIRDNVAFGPRMAGMGRKLRAARAEEMLALVGLAGMGGARPTSLSGGQRQRVALARALAVEPQVLLLDEPLGALDLKLRRAMQDELKAIQREVGTTFMHVTHDQEEAMAIADRIVVMNAGRIEDEGPPARVYRAPRSLFAADFMGEMNHIPAHAEAGGIATPFGRLERPSPGGGPLVACLRPEAVKTGTAAGFAIGPARVRDAAFFGTHARVRFAPEAAPDIVLLAHLPPTAVPEAGTVLALSADPADFAIFARE